RLVGHLLLEGLRGELAGAFIQQRGGEYGEPVLARGIQCRPATERDAEWHQGDAVILDQPGLDPAGTDNLLYLESGMRRRGGKRDGSHESRRQLAESQKVERYFHRMGPEGTGTVFTAAAASIGALVPCVGSSQPVAPVVPSPKTERIAVLTSSV